MSSISNYRRAISRAATTLALSAISVACIGSGSSEDSTPGTISASLTIATGVLDVRGVHFQVLGANNFSREQSVDLQRGGIGAADPALAEQWFADWLLSLPPGRYRVIATPTQADGRASRRCARARGTVDVLPEMTVELSLVSDCSGDANGGLDVSLALNQPPAITGLASPTGKFLCIGEAFAAQLTATDPDGDDVRWSWSVTSSATDPNANAEPYCLMANDGSVSFSSFVPGRYELTARVSDGRVSTALTFPVYLDFCGRPACPGELADDALLAQTTTTAGSCQCEGATPTIEFSPNDIPARTTVAPVSPNGQPRPVARYRTNNGTPIDFVEDELLVTTDDTAELADLLDRWGGTIRGTIDFSTLGVARPPVYRIAIDTDRADATQLANLWARTNGVTGNHTFSSTQGMALFAAAASEATRASERAAAQGVSGRLSSGGAFAVRPSLYVTINPIMNSDDFAGRTTTEQPTSAISSLYTSRDAYQWPHMNRASEQDFGTAEAWTLLNAAGRLSNTVGIAIADGGFLPNADFPTSTLLGPDGEPNPGSCGGDPCPWHGTGVALAAAGVPDNAIGVAGPAGPVANLTLLQSPAEDFFAWAEYIHVNIPVALASGSRILNISASASVPAEVCFGAIIGLPACEILHGITAGFRAAGLMIVSSAGNVGEDVDRTKDFCFPFCVEEEAEIIIPCELNGVTCVGGLSYDSNRKHANSRFGSNTGELESVDIYGPFTVYSVADAMAADDSNPTPDLSVTTVDGTSYAAPYVAGVAALVMAADPTLSIAEVETILRDTAHTNSSDPVVHRWVNALAATGRALGRDLPPFLRIVTRPGTFPRGVRVTLAAAVEELDGQPYEVVWRRNGAIIGRGENIRVPTTTWNIGANDITATATDNRGNASAVDTVRITLTGEPTDTITVVPLNTGVLCPQGPDAGDAEFGGGPVMTLSVNLEISPDQSQLIAVVDFAAQRGDSLVRDSFRHVAHVMPVGERIVGINSTRSFDFSHVGPSAGFESVFSCSEGDVEQRSFASGLIRQYDVIGDTGRDDISNDGDCRCDTQIRNLAFHPIQLEVVR